jgi:alpha-mannosidase
MDMLDRAEAVARTFGAEADTPVLASEEFRPVTAGAAQRQRFGKLDVLFDRAGIIRVRKGHVDLFGEVRQAYRTRRPLRMGELLLDADFGDAWGQRLAPFSSPQDDQCSIALGDYHVACERSAAAIRWHGSYTGGDPKVKRLEWTVTVRASGDGERLDFTVAVNWDTGSRRLRAVIPVNSQETTATYEIPYGFIERAYDPAKLDYSQWKANTMEFPTLHWGMKRIGANRGIAVLNKGLPCYRWMPGRWDISLLRSPEWNFCAVEPQAYEFWDIDGQRDTGEHLFEFSVLPFSSGLTVGDLTRSGYAYNGASPAVPFKVTGDVVVTAWKPAEDGTGWVLRLQDAGGTGTRVAVDFGKSCCVCRASLLEAQQEPCRTTRTFRGDLHKHGILTLLIKPACG